jgi:hypothetical protein
MLLPAQLLSLDDLMSWEDAAPQVKQAVLAKGGGGGGGGEEQQRQIAPSRRTEQNSSLAAVLPHTLLSIRCHHLCSLLAVSAGSMEGVDVDEVYSVLREVDGILDRKKRKGQEEPGEGGSAVFTKGPPFQSASSSRPTGHREEDSRRLKAAAAKRQEVITGISPLLYPASQLFSAVATQKTEEKIGGMEAEQRGEGQQREQRQEEEGKERQAAGVVEHEPEEQRMRLEVVAKYLFVHCMLQRLLKAAEFVSRQQRIAAAAAQSSVTTS